MFRLAQLSLKQRSLVALATLILIAAGIGTTGLLKQELIPSIEIPQVAVLTSYPGTSPEVVDEQVSQPLTSALSGLDGVEDITAESRSGFSTVRIEFAYGTDTDEVQSDVDQAIAGLNGTLPEGVTPKTMVGSSDDLPVISLAISSSASPVRLTADIEEHVIGELQKIEGVREATLSGAVTQRIVITPDPAKLTDAGLTRQSIEDALQANGTIIPAGSLDEDGKTYSVNSGTALANLDQLKAIPLLPAATGGQSGAAESVPLSDVATVELTSPEQTSITRTNGDEGLSVSVTKKPNSDAVAISHAVRDQLAGLEDDLGEGAFIQVTFDQAPFVERSIEDLTTEGALGLVFAVVVILIFLLSVRSTLVTAVSIPVSVLITMIGLYAGGHSLNMLTLGALTIAIGRVVDDSIVVIENIKRHLSYGEPKQEAILTGVKEVAGAITSSTLATVAVFLPIAVVGGMVGVLFRPFALTVVIALLSSLVVALTIVPVLAYWFLKQPAGEVDADRVREEAEKKERNSALQQGYLPILRATQRHPVITLLAAALILAGTVAAVPRLETDFLGDSGQNQLSVVQELPAGTDLAGLTKAATKVEQELLDVDGIETVQVTIGNSADGGLMSMMSSDPISYLITTDPDGDQAAIQDAARAKIDRLTGIGDVTITAGGGAAFGGSSTVDVIINAERDEDLGKANDEVMDALDDVAGSAKVESDLAAAQPTLEITVDRAKAADSGLSEAQVGGYVASVINPQTIGSVHFDGDELELYLYPKDPPQTAAELKELAVPTPAGSTVKLSSVAKVAQVDVPPSISSNDGERIATVSVTPEDGVAIGTLTESVRTALGDADLPDDTAAELGGVSADQADAFGQLGVALLVAIAIVYLIMVATFRSIVQPLILLISIPFAATGALLALLITGTPLGVAALVGTLMLVGIVVTNAIVLIDLVNQYRERGASVREAVEEGARQRLRPILMTALATIFALIPMALGLTGGGGFISRPLALVVIGGLISSTALTLILVPVLYLLVEGSKERSRARAAAPAPIADPSAPAADPAASASVPAPDPDPAAPVPSAPDSGLPDPAPEPAEGEQAASAADRDQLARLEEENVALRRMIADEELRRSVLVQELRRPEAGEQPN
ncbi:efflux RND transporter permease subunit [Microlunatus sp. GCM10028923]|uniref:efflux RND transporter permease subunit n=1 Tax=Microlunatus sp. GCM10028923 TaxID=3273400 RepID=UPI00361423A9